ncbi:MAG: PilZ domain-containing protein [Myxococcales bacterium]|nr:PilZ domain-containing protein [Myxococcales bacterium]
MEIDRRILLVDGPDGRLQKLALELIGRDFDVHYANDLDEARLLARDARGSLSAVLFSTALPMQKVPDLAASFGVAPGALVPVGPRPADRVVAALAFHGVRWHLFDDPPDEAIRFVISGVLFDQDPFEIRYHLRVPTSIPGLLVIGEAKDDVTIRDVSLGGACLVGGAFGSEREVGVLRFAGDGQEVEIPCRIAWAVQGTTHAGNIRGVSFLEVDPEAGRVLDALRDAVIARNRISKPG